MRDALQEMVEGLSEELSRSVLVDDPALRLLAHSPLVGSEDRVRVDAILHRRTAPEVASVHFRQGIATAEAPLRTPALPGIGLEARLCVPLRRHGRSLGFMWVIDPDGSLTEAEVGAASCAADAITDLLYREEAASLADQRRETALVCRLVDADDHVRAEAATEIRELGFLAGCGSLAAVAFALAAPSAEAIPEPELERASEPLRHWMLDRGLTGPVGAGLVVAVVANAADPQALGEGWPDIDRLHARFADALPSDARSDVYTGAGDPVGGLEDVYASYRQAAHAAEVRLRVDAGPPAARWSELGVYRMLLDVPLDDLGPEHLPRPLRALCAATGADMLVHTLERYLDLGCDVKRTATDLMVHRATLYYRLGRIEELADCDLREGETRLELHLGLKLARLAPLDPLATPAPTPPVPDLRQLSKVASAHS